MPKRLTTDEWVARARATHGDRYDYSLVEYVKKSTLVLIICPNHGEFLQKPIEHSSRGHGCWACATARRGIGRRLTTKSWIEQARSVHGSTYDYSKVRYTHSLEKVLIVCHEHGDFWQNPISHTRGGRRCPSCADRSPTTDEWIERARVVHGDRYDYSQLVYTTNDVKVQIICPDHGPFVQRASSHLNGCGCPGCCQSRGEMAVVRVLVELDVPFVREWSHTTCRDKKPLPFDFRLLAHMALIEFDGPQHFEPVRWPGMDAAAAERAFRGVQRRDQIKTDWTKANGFALLRLSDLDTVEVDVQRFVAELDRRSATASFG